MTFLHFCLTLWCVLRSLTTTQGTLLPTIQGLDLLHGIFCGNLVHNIGEQTGCRSVVID